MLFYFYKNQPGLKAAETFYWRSYLPAFLLSFIALVQFTGAVEALLFAWLLVDVIGFGLVIFSAFVFITGALLDKLQSRFIQKI